MRPGGSKLTPDAYYMPRPTLLICARDGDQIRSGIEASRIPADCIIVRDLAEARSQLVNDRGDILVTDAAYGTPELKALAEEFPGLSVARLREGALGLQSQD